MKHQIDHRAYLGLSLITLGLGLISWLAASIGHRFYPWRCEHCGWQKARSALSHEVIPGAEQPQETGFGVRTAMELKYRAERHREESEQRG